MSAAPKNPAPYWQWSAVELSGAIRDARVSALDAIRSVVDRMRTENSHLNAIVVDQTDVALEQAASYDGILKIMAQLARCTVSRSASRSMSIRKAPPTAMA